MKISTKVFAFGSLWYLAAFVLWLVARDITASEWEQLRKSVFYGSTLDIYPTFNWAHYAAFAALMVGVGVTIAGILLKRR